MSEVAREAVSPFFVAWAKFVLRFRWLLLTATLVSTVVAAWFIATNIRMDNSVEAFTASDSIDTRQLEEFRDEFGRDDMFLMLIEGDVFTRDYLQKLKKLQDEVEALNMDIPSLGQRSKRYLAWRARVMSDTTSQLASAERAGSEAPTTGPGDEPQAGAPARQQARATTATEQEVLDEDFSGFDEPDETGDAQSAASDANSAAANGEESDDFADFGGDIDQSWGDEQSGSIIDEVTSLLNARRTISDKDSLKVTKWAEPVPSQSELAQLKQDVLKDRTLLGQVVAANGRFSVMNIRIQFMSEDDNARVWKALTKIGHKHTKEGFKVLVAGPPALGSSLNDLLLESFNRLMALSMVAMFVLMIFIFRHPLGVIGPIGVVIFATLGTMGVMAALDWPLTMLSLIVPSFLVCVGIGDSVHLQVVYRQERLAGRDNHDAIIHSMGTTAIPVLFTTLTTMIGLLSFQFASTDAIREMGTSGAFGVFLALLHSLVFLPIVLSFNKNSLLGAKPQEVRNDFITRILHWCTSFSHDVGVPTGHVSASSTPRRLRALLCLIVLFLASVAGASLLRVYHNPVSWMPEGNETRLAFDALDAHLAGTATVSVALDTKRPGGVKSLKLLQAMEAFEAHVRAFEHPDLPPNTRFIGNTISLLDVVKETNRALHGGDETFYKLPTNDRGVSDLMFMFENASPDQLKQLVTNDMRQTHMTVRVRWVDATSYAPLVAHIESGVQKYFRDAQLDTEVVTTGAVYSIFSVISMIVFDLLKSFGVAFVVIAMLLSVMLRSVKLGLIGMVPNLMPIAVITGVMGVTEIPIDMVTLLIASIAIGIAVDDTIHYLHHFHTHYLLNGKVEEAIQYTRKHSGRAMVSTSTILVIGFGVFLASPMVNTQRFGGLVALTVIFALLIDIVFAPALLRALYKDFSPKTAP